MYLGIDLGTSAIKVLLLDEAGNSLGTASSSLSVSRPHPGWSEQDPATWISATEDCFAKLKARQPKFFAEVRGIGLSGQMHGATLLGENYQTLRPCMLWNDGRASQQALELGGQENFIKITGNLVFPGFTAPKVLWVAENEPKVFAQTRKILLPKDCLGLWLTGEAVSDRSDASGTAWLDVAGRKWSESLLGACHLNLSHMPRLVEGNEVAAAVRKELAECWGWQNPVWVAGGAGDNAASACGLGVVKEGDAFLSLGTSGVIFAARDGFFPAPKTAIHSFCHTLPATWHQMSVMLSAADCLDWLSHLLHKPTKHLLADVERVYPLPKATNVSFYPYLGGERTPYNDTSLRAAWVGLDQMTKAEDLTLAVLQGVGFALLDSLQALKMAGAEFKRLLAVGGGAKSSYWLSLLADLLQTEITLPEDPEVGAALGAARLARWACATERGSSSNINNAADQYCPKPRIAQSFFPRQTGLAETHAHWKSLVPSLQKRGT